MPGEEVTTSLNVDITQFKKAMTDANRYIRMANSEFDKATAGVEDWGSSTEGLRAKIGQLNKTLDGQEAIVAALRHEYERVAAEQGESSSGAQNLAIRLNKAEAAAAKTRAEAKKYADALEEAESSTKETEKATGNMSEAFGKAAKAAGTLAKGLAGIAGKAVVNGIKGIAAASAGLVTAFLASGEASKEHITEMAKLDAAYKSAGHSADTVAKTYDELYGVIGETDQAVEAAQQISLLAKSEEDAARWAAQGAGVIGKFGDALQPETFFEAANETFSLNEATGAYVQMIEQCGLSVDEFNAGLQACTTAEEKQAYMLAYTEQALGSAGEAYREANAAVIENNKANAALQESMAGVGEAALPVMSTLKLMGAALLNDLMPNIKTFGTSFKEALGGSKTAAADMGNAVGSMLKTLVQKFVAALPTVITVGTSIITSLVEGLVQATPALAEGVTQIVQYFIKAAPQLLAAGASMVSSLVGAIRQNLPQLLKSGGEMLYKLIDGVVSNLPAMAQGAMDAIGGFVKGIQTYLPVILKKGSELLGKLGEGIRTGLPGLVNQALDILMNFATTLYDNAPKLIETGFDLLSDLVSGIMSALPSLIAKGPEIISKFANIINDNFPKILAKGVQLIGQIIKGLLQAIPTLVANIPKIITAIVDVFEAFNWLNLGKNIIKFLKNGITSMVGAVKGAGKNVFDAIMNAIKALPQKLLSLGKNAMNFLKNAITGARSAVASAGGNILKAVVNAITSLPTKLLSIGQNAIKKLVSAFVPGPLKTKALNIVDTVFGVFKKLPSKMVSVGKDAINGIISGIGAMVGKLYDSIKNALGGLVEKGKKALGIASPSKVLADEIGKWIPAGIGDGIVKNTKSAVKAMSKSTKQILGAANSELSGTSLSMPGVKTTGTGAGTGGQGGNIYNFYQTNNSPKALSRADIYRQTKNQLRFATSNA